MAMQGSTQSSTARAPNPHFELDIIKGTWERFELHKGARPLIACVIVGGLVTVTAIHTGVPELIVGLTAAYAAYRMMRFGLSLPEVLSEGLVAKRQLSAI